MSVSFERWGARAVLVASLVVAGCSGKVGVPDGVDSGEAPDVGASALLIKGINEHPIWYAPSDPDLFFNLDSDLGVQASRADAIWSELETAGPGQYNAGRLAKMDAYMDAMKARGIRVTLIAVGAPAWATADGVGGNNRPPSAAHLADYANFCAFLVSRYHDRGLEAVEVWNEPAGYWAWYPSGDNGVAYAALLKAAYPAIKAAAAAVGADIQVLGCSLFSGGQDGRDRTLLDNVYAQGARDFFDVMSVHTYPQHTTSGLPSSPCYSAADPRSSLLGQWEYYTRPKMVAAGDGAKRVWYNELGAETGATGNATAQEQADLLTGCFTALKAHAPPANIERIYWYQLADKEGNPDQGWGLVNNAGSATQPVASDFTLKPAYAAFKSFAP